MYHYTIHGMLVGLRDILSAPTPPTAATHDAAFSQEWDLFITFIGSTLYSFYCKDSRSIENSFTYILTLYAQYVRALNSLTSILNTTHSLQILTSRDFKTTEEEPVSAWYHDRPRQMGNIISYSVFSLLYMTQIHIRHHFNRK